MKTLTRPQEKMWNALAGVSQPNPLRLTRQRVSEYIAQCDYGEPWYIHPVKIQWNAQRDEWKYWHDGNLQGHDELEDILSQCDPNSLVEFYREQVRRY
jgi:hypothetical protein